MELKDIAIAKIPLREATERHEAAFAALERQDNIYQGLDADIERCEYNARYNSPDYWKAEIKRLKAQKRMGWKKFAAKELGAVRETEVEVFNATQALYSLGLTDEVIALAANEVLEIIANQSSKKKPDVVNLPVFNGAFMASNALEVLRPFTGTDTVQFGGILVRVDKLKQLLKLADSDWIEYELFPPGQQIVLRHGDMPRTTTTIKHMAWIEVSRQGQLKTKHVAAVRFVERLPKNFVEFAAVSPR